MRQGLTGGVFIQAIPILETLRKRMREGGDVVSRLLTEFLSTRTVLTLILLLICGGCSENEPETPMATAAASGEKIFTDVAKAAGITHRHYKPILDHKLDNIMSWVTSVGAAAAAGDYDNDGWIDLYVINSRKETPNYLYRNNGDGTFTDVASQAGVADVNNDRGTSMDCVWGDVDNDGWIDLYVVRWGNDLLFRNNGD